MTAQPEALRLADLLDAHQFDEPHATAAELRWLHASCEDYAQHKQRQDQLVLELKAQRDALLKALRRIGRYTGEGPTYTTPWQGIVADLGQTARAAIASVEETK